MNRLRYLKYSLVLGVSAFLADFLTNMIAMFAFDGIGGLFELAMNAVIYIAWFIVYMTIIIRRLHDLDKRDLFAVCALIPFVNFFFALYLLFVPGTHGTNQYGRDPLEEF